MKETTAQAIRALFTYRDEYGAVHRVVGMAAQRGTYYLAVGVTPAGSEQEAVHAVVVVQVKKQRGVLVSYKAMHEQEGPYYWDCPGAILDTLTAPVNADAQHWRTRCRALLAGQTTERDLIIAVQKEWAR